MSIVINLYGGPGTGKSTSAAYLYYRLKSQGENVELVREYVKNWAWEKRHISEFDQFYFLGKQIRQESLLLGKVDYIVTDAPIAMNIFYADKYCSKPVRKGVIAAAKGYYNECERVKHQHVHVFLKRIKKYNPSGRFQTEEEAKKMDGELRLVLRSEMKMKFYNCATSEAELDGLLDTLDD